MYRSAGWSAVGLSKCQLGFMIWDTFQVDFCQRCSSKKGERSILFVQLLNKFICCQLLSRVCLFMTPWTIALQAPLSMGFSRQEYWSGLPLSSPEHLLHSGIKPASPALQVVSCIVGQFFTAEPPAKPHICCKEAIIKQKHLAIILTTSV